MVPFLALVMRGGDKNSLIHSSIHSFIEYQKYQVFLLFFRWSYDFLLGNYGPVLCYFRYKPRYWSSICPWWLPDRVGLVHAWVPGRLLRCVRDSVYGRMVVKSRDSLKTASQGRLHQPCLTLSRSRLTPMSLSVRVLVEKMIVYVLIVSPLDPGVQWSSSRVSDS